MKLISNVHFLTYIFFKLFYSKALGVDDTVTVLPLVPFPPVLPVLFVVFDDVLLLRVIFAWRVFCCCWACCDWLSCC